MQGKAKEVIPPTGPVFIWTDVRDVASAHYQAMLLPAASGQRFFVVGGYFSNKEIADVIRNTHPELAPRLPSEDAENDMPADVYGFDNTKSRTMLGLSYRDLKCCISDTVESLIKLGALEHQ
jgi:nucleoside-diphosphate-sugar epimerase